MKQIRFSSHAENRRKQRGLNKEHIFEVIVDPEYVKRMDEIKTATKTIYGRTVAVVYAEEETYIKAITAY